MHNINIAASKDIQLKTQSRGQTTYGLATFLAECYSV